MSFLSGAGKQKTTQPVAAAGLQFQSSTYGTAVQLVYGTTRVAPNLIWYGDFVATAQESSAGSGGKGGVGGGGGGKGGGSSGNYIYQTAVALGLCEGPILDVPTAYVDKNVTTPAALNLSVFLGDYAQSPWGYLTTNHPGEDLNYRGTAYLAASAYQLGNSPQLPNHNFEVQAIYSDSISGLVDADPSLVVTDLLANSHYGAGFPSARVGSLTTYQAYTIANGLWISPAYNQQSQASAILDDIAKATNSEFVWSGGALTLVPYGDETITANGYTYTAPSAPLYDLTDDDFVASSNPDPVQIVRKRPADALNSIKIECLDRANNYNPAILEAKDQAAIDLFGPRQGSTKQFHLFADLNAGKQSAQLQLQRQAIRNAYSFTLDARYILLDPMDIVTITDAGLGLNRQWVRITEISEDDNGNLTMTAEEYLSGTGSAPAYSFQSANGYNADYNSAPGNANAPLIFEPPIQITQTGGLEADIVCSGGANWGGCDVYISADNTNFKLAGRITGSARQGTLAAPMSSGSDPDTTHTLQVDLSTSRAALLSGTQTDADLAHTLCYVDGEYIAYQDATLTGAYTYTLGTYLRRGMFGSTIASHATGSGFARLDKGVFAYAYDKSQIGTTIYVKLASFNIFGGGQQSLASVSSHSHVLTGPPLPDAVVNFQVSQNGIPVVFTWDDLETDVGLKGYDIAYGLAASAWADKHLLTEAARGTEMTNADVPPGAWEFSIRGRDIADNLGAESLIQYTVTNPNALVIDAIQEPGFVGSLSGFIAHPSGVLVVDSQFTPAHYADYTPFNTYVPDPVTTASYTTAINDIGYNSNLRVYDTHTAALGVGQTGAAASLQLAIDTWLDGASDPASYTNWTSGYVNFRYLKGRITYSGITAGNVSYLNDFTVIADIAPSVQQSGTLAISAGGTTLTFPNAYHTPPYVTATAISTTGLYASVASVTATSCIIHVWNSSGTDVGGNVNWTSNGA